ncbi:MAG: ATP-binding protein, partial [Motiliproteus sp.]
MTHDSLASSRQLMTTELEWNDLVLNHQSMEQLNELENEIGDKKTRIKRQRLKHKVGCTSLFYGPSGTGKTLAATLLGKRLRRDIYRIDLSLLVSKYIGETEKNLSRIFNAAKEKNFILFFDEADALFGKRTNINDAHDRFSNQTTSYLLSRIETFTGVAILSSNTSNTIDDVVMRKLFSIIKFPIPDAKERTHLCKRIFSNVDSCEAGLDIPELVSGYPLSGGAIVN